MTAAKQSVSPLFRREAIQFQQYQRQWGDVVLLQPVSTQVLAWSLSVSTAAIIIFLTFAQYARKDTAIGYLTPMTGTAKIFAPQQGVVSEVFVKAGEQVSDGQPLLRLATDQLSGGGEDVNGTIIQTLEQQRTALTAQIDEERRRNESEKGRLAAQQKELEGEIATYNAQLDAQRTRVSLMQQIVAGGATLALKGLVSQVDQKHREDALLQQQQALITLSQQVMQARGKLTEVEFNLAQLPFALSGKVQSLRNELSSVLQRLAEINGRRAFVVRAPIGGVISLLQASVGQQADPHRVQLEIVPPNAKLEAVLFVPARAGGFLHVGQQVRLLYDSFPYQKYGTHLGHVVEVSQTVLTGSDVSGPVALKEPAYKVIASLDESAIKTRDKKTIPLQPDMLLRADIILEQRTVMSWLLEPILSARM